jgi:hypothetical protein
MAREAGSLYGSRGYSDAETYKVTTRSSTEGPDAGINSLFNSMVEADKGFVIAVLTRPKLSSVNKAGIRFIKPSFDSNKQGPSLCAVRLSCLPLISATVE